MEQMGIHTEDLGSKTIAGAVADGTRTVRTVRAGQAGDNQPIRIVNETWIAKDPNLELLRVDDNSRTGRVVTEVVGLKQDKPDPALFAPPAGYSPADANPSL
jgi:hypothetical protein